MKTPQINILQTNLLHKQLCTWVVKAKTLINVLGALLLLILMSAEILYAQNEQGPPATILSSKAPSLRFEHIGLEDGMAQASGNTIMQDSQGYLWVATQGGLHRYNGHEFKVYASIPFDTTSLSESWVWAASESENGDLWVTTEGGGLNRMNPATGKAKHYRHDPEDSTSISSDRTFFPLEASNGDLWVSTLGDGLNRMHAGEDGIFTRYRHDHDDPESISSDVLFWLSEDSDGHIWAGSANGINRINPKTDAITRFLYDPESRRGYGGAANVLGQYLPPDEPGILWVATGNGLVWLDSKTGNHKRYLIAENENRTSPLNFLHEVIPDPNDSAILWVGGPGAGVARFDMRTEQFTGYRNDPRDPHSLSNNFVTSLFADRSGTMWVGTATSGLDAFNPGAVNFIHLRHNSDVPSSLAPGIVWGVYEDLNGTLWVGTDVGAGGHTLSQFDAATLAVKRHRFNPNDSTTLLPGSFRSFLEDHSGGFWVAGGGGLSRLDRATGKVTRFRHEFTEQNRGRNTIFALHSAATDSGKFWVGSAGGIDQFNTQTGEYTRVPFSSDSTQVDPVVLSLLEDSNDILWAGTNEGLFRIAPSGKVTLASAYDPTDTTKISNNGIYSITEREEEPGILWLATPGGGLNRFNTHTGIAIQYTTASGLANNTIYGILEDNSGTLWMSSNGGIINFDPKTETVRNYGLDDGLMALEYSQNAYTKGSGGVLYFGSGEGVTAFVPEQLSTNAIPPQVVISDFKLFNKSVAIGPDSPLKNALSEAKEITLKHNQNEVTFDFVALHFANPQQNRYSYRLEGFDEEWVDAGTQRTATYTNLEPGSYTFRVKAANSDGVWNEEGASIKLGVLPPWYRTWWAYGLFIGIFCTGVFGVDRIQRRRLSKKEQERTALREAELRAEAENKRRSDTEQLSKIGRAITSTLSVHKIIETVYENVNALMDATIFGVGIYNKDKHCLDFPATKEKGEMLPSYVNKLDEDNWLSVWCFKNREEIIIGDFNTEHTRYIEDYEPPLAGKLPTSVLYLPLVQQDRTIGVITTQSFQKNAYSEYHVNLLRNLATYAAIALDNASAYRQLNATLSKLKTMQQQLVQQEKLASLGQLTAGIAHEIKNPLNFVNNFSELSVELVEEAREELKEKLTADSHQLSENAPLEGSAEAERRRGMSDEVTNRDLILEILNDIETNLRKIHEHGSRADSIVKSMLQHSRGGSGNKQAVDLNALVREYVNLSFHGMRAGSHPINVDIDYTLDNNLRQVEINPEDMSRVLINLCNNAFDAMRGKLTTDSRQPSGNQDQSYKPKLTVGTFQNDHSIAIEIEDNGPGIPEAMKDKILQPFFTTKQGTEGTGLGLSISNDIVKAHGGSIEIESKTGRYTRFIIKIPT